MKNSDALTDAQYIFSTGKLIHDIISRMQMAAGMEKGKRSRFGELSAQQLNMILMIRVRESASVTELAGILNVSPPSVSTMVDRLVERGLLTRTHSKKDRRRVEIRVVPEVVKEIAEVEKKIQNSFSELVQALDPEITRQWCQVLQQVKQVIDAGLWPPKSIFGNPD